jgi:putative methylase
VRKRHLEIALSKIDDIEDPDPKLEQYRTPPVMVADILWMAMENGDVIDKDILELGCGGAPFALGALMLGASRVRGIDIDERSINLARANLEKLMDQDLIGPVSDRVDLLTGDLSLKNLELEKADTIFMNPPFGAQNKHADRPFIEAACKYGRSIYSIHNGGTEKFLIKQYDSKDFDVVGIRHTSMEIPHRFHFHSKERTSIDVLVLNALKR